MAKEFGLKGVLSLDGSPWAHTLREANARSREFGHRLGAAGILAASGIGVGIAAALAFSAALVSGVGHASKLEVLSTPFISLLGNVEAAQRRMEELHEFSLRTPFTIEGIAQASFILERMTKGALATGKGLDLVGDVAAAINKPIEDVSTNIGLLYAGLEGGTSVDRAVLRLKRMGVITPEVAEALKNLHKTGISGDAAWSIAEKALGRFHGGMETRAKQWAGLWERFKKTFGAAFLDLGGPLLEQLKPVMTMLITGIEQIRPLLARVGQFAATVIPKLISGALNFAQILAGAFADPGALVDVLAAGLKMGVQEMWDLARAFVGWFIRTLSAGWDMLIDQLADLFSGDSGLVSGFQKFIGFIGTEFKALGPLLGAALVFAGAKMIDFIRQRMLDIAVLFGSVIEFGIHEVLEQLAKIPVIGKKLFPSGKEHKSFEDIFMANKADADKWRGGALSDFTQAARDNLSDATKDFMESGSVLAGITIKVKDKLTAWAEKLNSGAMGEEGRRQFRAALDRLMKSGARFTNPFRAAAAIVGSERGVAMDKWHAQFQRGYGGYVNPLGDVHVQGIHYNAQGQALGTGPGQAYHMIRSGDAYRAAKAKLDAEKKQDKGQEMIDKLGDLDDSINEPEWTER
jgi:hypothetical protein